MQFLADAYCSAPSADAVAHRPTLMRISVIHPSRNEHAEITATVDSMLAAGADEVIVFDDGSEPPLQVDGRTNHVRHEVSRGPSVCRNLGAQTATGDVLVFADAHTRIGDLRGIAAEAIRRQCIMVPAMKGLTTETVGYGRNFILNGKDQEKVGFDTSNVVPSARYTRCGGNWGGFFIMPRSVYDRIGGWVDHSSWGFNDPSLILKAWMCDVPVVLDRDTIYRHKGKVKCGFGYPVKAVEPILNLIHTYFVLFDAHTFKTRWLPLYERHQRWMIARGLAHIRQPRIQAEAAHFKTLKKRTDAEFDAFVAAGGYNGEVADV